MNIPSLTTFLSPIRQIFGLCTFSGRIQTALLRKNAPCCNVGRLWSTALEWICAPLRNISPSCSTSGEASGYLSARESSHCCNYADCKVKGDVGDYKCVQNFTWKVWWEMNTRKMWAEMDDNIKMVLRK